MRFIRCAATALALAGAATVAASGAPAFAAVPAPVIDVTPSVAVPGSSVTFAVTCGAGATSATLFGTTLGLSERIGMEQSTHAGEFVASVHLPAGIGPGGYSPSIDCDNGMAGTAALTVNPAPDGPLPSGAPVTGDGATSSATGGPFATAGLGLLAAGGVVVSAALLRVRRRRAGARP